MHHTGAPKGDMAAMLCREEAALDLFLSHSATSDFEEIITPVATAATPAEAPVATVTLTDYQRSQPMLAAAEDEEEDEEDDLGLDDEDLDDADLDDEDLDDADLDDEDLDDEDLDLEEDEDEEDDVV